MRSDRTTYLARVDEVLSLRLLGAELRDIKAHAAAQEWGVTERTLWRYIAAGDKVLAKTLERDRQKILDRHIAQRRSLFARAMSVSDYRTALSTLQDECALLGLYPPKKIAPTTPDGEQPWSGLRRLTDDELALMVTLAERAAQRVQEHVGQEHVAGLIEGNGKSNGTPHHEPHTATAAGPDLSGTMPALVSVLCGADANPL